MQQKENEEREYQHNYRGSKPSTFTDVEDAELRNSNRGAILANIFERYTTKDSRGREQLQARDFSLMTRELEDYLSRLPRMERGIAQSHMRAHLSKRGYAYAS